LTVSVEKSIPIIPCHSIPAKEVYSCFTRAGLKAAHSTFSRRVCATYLPCVVEEDEALLEEYEMTLASGTGG